MIKVAFLNPTIPPRVVSLLNKINKSSEIELRAYFFSVSQKNRLWSINSREYEKVAFPYTLLNSLSIGFGFKDYHNSFLSLNIYSELSKFQPDVVVIPGWADINSYIALIWSMVNQKKIILRTESTEHEDSFRRKIFFQITKYICDNSHLIIACSDRAKRYAESITKTKVIKIYSSFDTVSFSKILASLSKEKLKIKYKIKEGKIIYFNGQLIERKGVIPLLESFTDPSLKNVALVVTGNGKLLEQMTDYSTKYSNIYFFGYQNQNTLPNFYKIADIFILPSYEETWGLVVIEALAAGLPVIVSKLAGSSEIIDKNRGMILNNINASNIQRAIKSMLKMQKNKISEISKNNSKFATNELAYESISQQFIQAFNDVI